MTIFAEVTEQEYIIDQHVRVINTLCDSQWGPGSNIIEMPFALYGRAMLDARCLCDSWASCNVNYIAGTYFKSC